MGAFRIPEGLGHKIWTAELSSLSGWKRMAVRLVRVAHLVIKGFREDDLPAHAAALTFSTLMSFVPLLVIAFAILKGLGAGPDALARLQEAIADMPQEFQAFILQMLGIVERTNFTALGSVGVAVLFVTVVQVLGNVESSINRVWGVSASRTIWRRFTNYISITVVVPVLVMVGFAISATLHSETFIASLGNAAFVYRALLRLSPLVMITLAFFLLIVFMPNTRVNRSPAAIAALIAAILWVIWQKVYISLQVSLAKYNALYGTFASLPIFLLWLYVGWMIVLLGSEIAFALQNHNTFHMERAAEQASFKARIMLAVSLALEAARALQQGVKFDAANFAQTHSIPIRLVNDLSSILVKGGILGQLAESESAYVMLIQPDRLHVGTVISLVTNHGSAPGQLGLGAVGEAVGDVLKRMDVTLAESLSDTTFAKLLQSAP